MSLSSVRSNVWLAVTILVITILCNLLTERSKAQLPGVYLHARAQPFNLSLKQMKSK
jgi:hypothetical protein